MKLKNMFKKTIRPSALLLDVEEKEGTPQVPRGLLKKCNKCQEAIIAEDVKKNLYICPKCNGYFRMHAYERIKSVTDEGSFQEWDKDFTGENPLHFKGYPEKVQALQEKTGLREAIVTGKATIGGIETVIGVCDGRFLMASMGEAVGEKIARAAETATRLHLPLILFACSGGARMQEGMTSLMQMAKTSAAIKRHSKAGLLYISVLTDPTTGGVTASFAMLGDIILAEPKALIGFAGPRVIEQTIGQKLPKGFQRSEFLLEHGFIDRIVERKEMKITLAQILQIHSETERKVESLKIGKRKDSFPNDLSAWERVQISRRNDRPVGTDYIPRLFSDFMEFSGDRNYGDDKAILGGIARFHGVPVTVIVQAKGKNTKENIMRNFGMPSPEGYRKALRLMKQAEKFHRPVICLVDTPGAFCGLEAEERGQGEAIARNIYEMSDLKVPVLSIIIGEGGSGGALAMAVADQVWMLENSVYSILSPEGFASILWKDSRRAKEAAKIMHLTSYDLQEEGFIEEIIPEPEIFTTETMDRVTKILNTKIVDFLNDYGKMTEKELVDRRYERFRKF